MPPFIELPVLCIYGRQASCKHWIRLFLDSNESQLTQQRVPRNTGRSRFYCGVVIDDCESQDYFPVLVNIMSTEATTGVHPTQFYNRSKIGRRSPSNEYFDQPFFDFLSFSSLVLSAGPLKPAATGKTPQNEFLSLSHSVLSLTSFLFLPNTEYYRALEVVRLPTQRHSFLANEDCKSWQIGFVTT